MANLIGKQIDQYLVQQLIDRGGMAEVYLAIDVTLQRQVALKVMLSELAIDQTATARFRREAEAVARLHHPNIIQIYTTGVTPDNRSYLAMQYVPGGTLQQKLAELSRQGQQMSVGESLYLARQVAAALQVAHQQDIVHRDLKPSNILLHSNGEPVITDLGIAAMDTGATRLTQTGNVMGTPHYMSPEQALGQKVDSRSDIYSLGVILYELLTGHVPFAADSPLAVLHQHIYEPPQPLTQVRPGLSRSTYQTVDTCLQKEPERRFQTAQGLVEALDHSLMSEGLRTPAAVTSYPTVKIPEQRRWWPILILATLGAVFIAIVVIGYVVFPREADSLPATATIPIVIEPMPTQVAEATLTDAPTETLVPTESVLFDPGCTQVQENNSYVGDDGDVCIGGTKLLDLDVEAGGCTEVGEISPSPSSEHFVVVLRCSEGENDAFVFRIDGSEKKHLTNERDYIIDDEYIWTDDGYFVYKPINSLPQTAFIWYQPETGQKVMADFPSPLEQYNVVEVASDDVLNIRSNAGAEKAIVGSIPYNGTGIIVTGLGTYSEGDQWVPIIYQDLMGWVNSYYIQAQASDSPKSAPQTTADVTAAFLAAPPTIDGSLREWSPGPTFLSAFRVHPDYNQDAVNDVEAVWQLGWDYSNLYMAVTVTDDVHVQINSDDQIYRGDDLEIQIDADLQGDAGAPLNTDDFQLNVSAGDFLGVPPVHHLWRSNAGGSYQQLRENSIVFNAQDQGEADYTLEIAVPWRDLGITPSPGLRIGIALNVSDNDVPGTAVQEVLKSSSKLRKFADPNTWGTLTLQE